MNDAKNKALHAKMGDKKPKKKKGNSFWDHDPGIRALNRGVGFGDPRK